ncbi:MAG: hypothetical protein Q9208_006553 [Pyrenodesmia sp. 3 TL-2023]
MTPSSSPLPTLTSTVPASSYPLCPNDSPLSTTANVLSILTFAFALLASYIALLSATRGAPAEIQRLVDDLRATQREINRTAEYIMGDIYAPASPSHLLSPPPPPPPAPPPVARSSAAAAPPRVISPSDVLYEEVQGLLKTCITLFYEADDLLKRSERDPYGFRRRVLFLLNREVVAEKMARLEGQKAKLGEIRMGLFLRKSARQDEILRRIADAFSSHSGGWVGEERGKVGNGEAKREEGGAGIRRRNSVDSTMTDGKMGWKSSVF